MDKGDISRLAGLQRQIPVTLLTQARELRKNQTPAEEVLWQCLRNRQLGGLKFRRQHNIGQYIADFYCHQARLVIEVDGEVHNTQRERDADRDQWMINNGFSVLRFRNDEVFNNLPIVLAKILQTAASNP
ncbi:MAG TPA: DUF559 domain-containing protein [Leptolyngbyaceae cyanobacterium]